MLLYYVDAELAETAGKLSQLVPGFTALQAPLDAERPLQLYLDDAGLWLHSHKFKPFNLKHFYQEFIAKRQNGLAREMLLQALNLKSDPQQPSTVLDLTGGLGRDALLMSLAGFRVTMLENNPYLAVILHYLCLQFGAKLPGLQVVYSVNQDYLQALASEVSYDLVYLDPMFQDGKPALAKKDIQLIELCIHSVQTADFSQANEQLVFKLARRHCRHKIIVKRDNKQPRLVQSPKPTYCKAGKTIRFDVYQC